jgi:nitrogen regulatory protein P-II 1
MKLVIAIIRPEKLDAVQRALQLALDEGENYRITVQTVDGNGRQGGEVEASAASRCGQPRAKDSGDDRRQRSLRRAGDPSHYRGRRTAGGEIGDGKIFVVPLEECVRIRTGERGGAAI